MTFYPDDSKKRGRVMIQYSLDHIVLNAKDEEAMMAFYMDVLMLRARTKITLHFGGQFILSDCVIKTRCIPDMPAFLCLVRQAT